MTTPIEKLIDGVLKPIAPELLARESDDVPYATHEGVLEIGGFKLRCYRLNNGMAIFNADDVLGFFSALNGEE